jgi:hypothetical protein
MNAIPFDTLKMARKPKAAGFPGPQAAGAAEAMAEAMSGAELATKADVLAVKSDVQAAKLDVLAVKADLTHEIGLVRSDLTRETTAMKTRLSAAIMKVANDGEILRRDITIRLGAVAIASTGIILAAMRIMLAHT